MLQSFVKLHNVNDALFFKKMLDLKQYQSLVTGLWKKKKYIFYPELNILMNEYNTKEIYILKDKI